MALRDSIMNDEQESSPIFGGICLIALGIIIGLAWSEFWPVDSTVPEVKQVTNRGARQ